MSTQTPIPGAAPSRVLVLANPESRGSGERARDVAEALRDRGVTVFVRKPKSAELAQRMALVARDEGIDLLAVVGGDGTMHNVANVLRQGDMPVAVVPSGMSNVLAHSLSMPDSAEALASIIIENQPKEMWPGEVDGQKFVAALGFGFDTNVRKHTPNGLKRVFGRWAYWLTALVMLIPYRKPKFYCEVDGVNLKAAAGWITTGNVYAGKYQVCRYASPFDKKLHVTLFQRGRRRDIIRYALKLMFGGLDDLQDVLMVHATHIKVTSAEGQDPVHADGEIIGVTPIIVTQAEQPLMVVPAKVSRKRPRV
jgi:diacylglycerol kinase (ATP)